jgi:hypothetical protein
MDETVYKRFWNANTEISIRRIVCRKDKEQWQKIGIYMIKYKDKLERMVRKNESEVQINLGK